MPKLLTFATLLVLTAVPGFGQGRGRIPTLPSQTQSPGQFPGFPENAGTGQPATPGQPATAPQPNGTGDGGVDLLAASGQLERTPALAGRLAEMLGVLELTTEPDGFDNLGLFVAAVQVSSHVEGTTFEGIKTRLLGDDTTEGMSLGEAIQDEAALSEADAADAAEQATEEAEDLIENAS